MSGFICPYCFHSVAISKDTVAKHHPCFLFPACKEEFNSSYVESCIEVIFYKCSNCGEYTIAINGKGSKVSDIRTVVRPISKAKHYPDYIPESIRKDYEEAYAILNLSPKASATLSRRCLQGMIHDFWNIKGKNLNQEITALKDKIQPDLWASIDALRQLGNIGAHMEKDTHLIVDIDPQEAEKLIKLIELLIKEWYINREERNKLFAEIITTNGEKQLLRKKNE